MRKLFQNEKFIAWAASCIIYFWGAFICHNYFGVYVLGFLAGFLSLIVNFLIRISREKTKEVFADICETCADRGHCEWWCNGTAYTLSDKYKDVFKKQDKYHWHNLRKNPEDLPPKNHKVLIYSRLFGYSVAAITITGWYDGLSTTTVADEWCEIKPSETDTNRED